MLASAVPGLVGWTVIAGAPGSVLSAVFGRFLVGVGMGIAGAIYPVGKWKLSSSLHYEPSSILCISPPLLYLQVYVCELSDKRWRGPMAASGVIVITCGLFSAFILGTFVHYKVI